MTKAGRKNSITYTISNEINAPLEFVYDWCTDFREDDTKLTGSTSKRILIEKKPRRVVYAMLKESGSEPRGRVYVVKLKPPDSWTMNAHGDGSDSTGVYKLRKIPGGRTKLSVTFTHRYYDTSAIPTWEKKKQDSQETWNKYASALEADFTGN